MYSDRVFKSPEVAANQAQAEAVVCDRCGKQVHPSNWMKHQKSDHGDDPKPLHEAQKDVRLPLAAIRTDGGTQPRAFINDVMVAEYAEEMNTGSKFPPITVFFDGQEYWLADGFHRVSAAKSLAWLDLPADVHQGTQRDAVLFSVGVNAAHGLRRTNSDKRRAVERLLRDEEWSKWSNVEIAKRCSVDEKTVRNLRPIFGKSEDTRVATRNGTTYEVSTGNIGKSTLPPVPDKPFNPPVTRPPFAPVSSSPVRYSQAQDDYVPEFPAVQVDDSPEEDWQSEAADTIDEVLADQLKTDEPAPAVATYAHHRSTTNEWYTPVEYVNAAREVMAGITLDPASCEYANKIVRAAMFYDIDTNGLLQPWEGSVFLNPPYGLDDNGDSNVATWVAKLISEFNGGKVKEAILLVNATPERKWFQPLWQYPVCFTDHRIQFYNANGQSNQPTQGNAFVYLGPHKLTFAAVFADFGTVVSRMGV